MCGRAVAPRISISGTWNLPGGKAGFKMEGMKTIKGQPSWRIASDRVEAFVTELGGQIGPIMFDRRGRKIAPYSVAPWAEEKLPPKMPAIFSACPLGGMPRRSAARNIPCMGKPP